MRFQLEIHLYNPQHKLLAFLKSRGIVAEAYSPLGSANSPLLTDEVASSIAQKYSLQTSDILLGYLRMVFISIDPGLSLKILSLQSQKIL